MPLPPEDKFQKRAREFEEVEEDRKRLKMISAYHPEHFANRNAFSHAMECPEIIGTGECKEVRRGTYDGERGQCVVKRLKEDGGEGASLSDDVKAAEKALTYLAGFHEHIATNMPAFSGKITIRMNVPEIFVYCNGRAQGGRVRKLTGKMTDGPRNQVLCEPLLSDFQKFNSNSGAQGPEALVAQSLSHYSFHKSNGEEILCDLQGSKAPGAGHNYTLSDCAINSKAQEHGGGYGEADLGAKGIETFMSKHVCSPFCSPSWKKWHGAKTHFLPVLGTTPRQQKGLAPNAGETVLEPSGIFFSQSSIADVFQNGKTLHSVAVQVAAQKLAKRTITIIRVLFWGGKWWTLDNRRLAIYRILSMAGKISFVRAKVVQMADVRAEWERKYDGGNGETIRLRVGFGPENRIGLTVSDTTETSILQAVQNTKVLKKGAQMSDEELVTLLTTLTAGVGVGRE